MSYLLPPLPYGYADLEPYIDAQTMEIHYTKHHQSYIDNLNNALLKYPHAKDYSLEYWLKNIIMIPEDIRETVKNNAGGHYNHSFFWKIMKKNGGGQPTGLLAQEIIKTFGSFEEFNALFNANAKKVFGSGWSWLSVDSEGKLALSFLSNQDNPLSWKMTPIMGLDVWEHAYYLKYQNKRIDYIDAWWNVINWEQVEENYREAIK